MAGIAYFYDGPRNGEALAMRDSHAPPEVKLPVMKAIREQFTKLAPDENVEFTYITYKRRGKAHHVGDEWRATYVYDAD